MTETNSSARDKIFTWIAVVMSVIVLSITVYQTSQTLGVEALPTFTGKLLGFESIPDSDTQFNSLKDSFNSTIRSYNARAATAKTTLIWIGFVVTALTAASTLISSIQASKKSKTSQRQSLVIIAILTFLATLGNWGNSTFSERKDDLVKKSASLINLRNEFVSVYFKAASPDAKRTTISVYENQLNDYLVE